MADLNELVKPVTEKTINREKNKRCNKSCVADQGPLKAWVDEKRSCFTGLLSHTSIIRMK